MATRGLVRHGKAGTAWQAWKVDMMQQQHRNELIDEELPGIGHNRPPSALEAVDAALLREELSGDRESAEALLARAATALINTVDDAARVQTLAVALKDLHDPLDARRLARTAPYREATKSINDNYGTVIDPLARAYQGLVDMLTVWNNQQRREADRLRREAEAEAEAKRRAAEEAQQRADEARTLADDVAAVKLQEEADLASRRAATIRPQPIPTIVGSVGSRRQRGFEVEDFNKAVRWLVKVNQAAFRLAVTELVRKQIGTIPVASFEATETPGIRKWLDEKASVRRA